MNDSDLKSDQYTIGPDAGDAGSSGGTVCLDAKGNVLFKVSNRQFLGNDGKTIGELRQGQSSSALGIYDDSGRQIGNISSQQQQATLSDASSKAIATASQNANSGGFNINSPDGKSTIATVSMDLGGQQQGGRGGFGVGMGGGILGELAMGGIGMGGMGRQGNQNAQRKLTISVQNQTIKPLLLLSFAYSLPSLLGQGGRGGRRAGMGGMGGMMMGGAAGMILGGLLGGGLGGGGSSGGGPRIPRIPRIR